jgi:putative acetyltransferase
VTSAPPDGLVIRPERADDDTAIRRVVGDAFGSPVEPDLVERIRASKEYLPELALVAELDGEIVGHVMISGAVVRNERGDHPIVMLSPLAVDPDHERRGIGAALIAAATRGAAERGEPFVVLEGDPAYYSRFGFEHSLPYGIELPLPDWAPPEAGQLLRLPSFDPDDGDRRGPVVYPSAFEGVE